MKRQFPVGNCFFLHKLLNYHNLMLQMTVGDFKAQFSTVFKGEKHIRKKLYSYSQKAFIFLSTRSSLLRTFYVKDEKK